MIIKNTKNKKDLKLNIVVTGPYKIGKTFLLKELVDNGQRVFGLSVESGMLCLAGVDVDYVECPDLKTIVEGLEHIEKNQADYDWIAMDTVTELGQNIWPMIRDKYQKRALSENKKPGAFNQQAWGEFGETIGKIVKRIRSLDLHSVIYAHPIDKEQEDGSIMVAPDIYGKSASRIVGWLDEIYYMHMKDGERFFLTQQTDKTIAGSRFGKLEKIEPASLWGIQQKVLNG